MKVRPSADRVAEMLEIRPETGEIVWRKSAGRAKAGDRAGRVTVHGYHEVSIDGRYYFGHSLIFFAHHGWWPDRVDHINGIKLDNRIVNLRCVDAATNARNRATHVTDRGLIGAHRVSESRWASAITTDEITYQLGTFGSEQEAHEAYLKARKACEEAESKARHAVLFQMATPRARKHLAARQQLTVLEQLQAERAAA